MNLRRIAVISSIFLILYCLIILVFAYKYKEHYAEFYYPNIKLEKGYTSLIENLTKSLQRSTEKNLEANTMYSSTSDECLGKVKSIRVNNVIADESKIVFDIRLETSGGKCMSEYMSGGLDNWNIKQIDIELRQLATDGKPKEFRDGEEVKLVYGGPGKLNATVDNGVYLLDPKNITDGSSDSNKYRLYNEYYLRHVFPPSGKGDRSRASSFIPIGRDTQSLMIQAIEASQGKPSVEVGDLWRMVYFSVSTFTTLGFGDITPISEDARTLVMLEALLGPILIGAYFAILTYQKSN